MEPDAFTTTDGRSVTAVTAAEMQAVDRVAVEEFGVALLQMMENAGRTLAWHVRDVAKGPVTVLAGSGGNGGGGLCGGVVTREPGRPRLGRPRPRPRRPRWGGAHPVRDARRDGRAGGGRRRRASQRDPETVVDALVGYGLDGPLRGDRRDARRRTGINRHVGGVARRPVGPERDDRRAGGAAVHPDRALTLALPKTGLIAVTADLLLADIAFPAGVYESLDVPYASPFTDEYWTRLAR